MAQDHVALLIGLAELVRSRGATRARITWPARSTARPHRTADRTAPGCRRSPTRTASRHGARRQEHRICRPIASRHRSSKSGSAERLTLGPAAVVRVHDPVPAALELEERGRLAGPGHSCDEHRGHGHTVVTAGSILLGLVLAFPVVQRRVPAGEHDWLAGGALREDLAGVEVVGRAGRWLPAVHGGPAARRIGELQTRHVGEQRSDPARRQAAAPVKRWER